jgi:hypothetical protein
MATSVVSEAKQYLYRYGVNTDTTIDPIDLIRDLVRECERGTVAHPGKKPAARAKSYK